MNKSSVYLETIQRLYPDFPVYSIQTNTDGQNNDILIVNDAFIFRFPKYIDGVERLERECALLKGIGDFITLPIPHISFEQIVDQTVGQVFLGYRIIPGVPLWRETVQNICEEHILTSLALQLAQFLRELHSIPSDVIHEQPLPVADTYEEWRDIYTRIQMKCYPYMRLDARLWATHHFETFLADSAHFAYKPVLKHGDFGPSNILFDAEKQVISGIIDFGGAGLGDPAYDFAGILSGYGETFLRRFVAIYPEIEAFWDRITFYQGTFALLEALFGIENQDQNAFESGIKEYV
ncbi:phosphotransferase family protein [Tengunoibacter tsumagoiensis]|uniref:6'-aminoglycoside N-acetyltransferase n=1 Tax=Tengunoibacter tsumagoiensis TaxID=2014871 RepID=A0A402A636_9CHLR|nr:phosphotransferase [Tengunoibacter tsumagoiensis]GCE14549.1 6'-aminoglycoside N-acetyltransferase [Tengunoibacter tsumagoiensis]